MTTDNSGVRIRAKTTLATLVHEAREDEASPEVLRVDWDRVDDKVFARIFADSAPAPPRPSFIQRSWRPFAASLAMAAGLGFLALHSLPTDDETRTTAEMHEAAHVQARSGAFLVNGSPLAAGQELRVDDTLRTEARGAVFARTGVLFGLEGGTRSIVRRGDAHLVVALEEGAIEAQVTPVPLGEAFAIDVGQVRVAVHGTHFRVERHGDAVTVDLTEGIISVGAPSRVGSTYGDLVTAPAHVEFGLTNAEASLHVTHDAALVRKPANLSRDEAEAREAPTVAQPTPAVTAAAHGSTASPRHAAPAAESPKPTALEAVNPAAVATPPVGHAVVDPDKAIALAVQQCFDARDSAGELKVSVTSALKLTIGDDGQVQVATFQPPLPPDVQKCASTTIYAQHFDSKRSHTLPLELHER